MLANRKIILLRIFVILFLCLTVRFIYIQIFAGEKFSKAAAAQRVATADLNKPRGDILDRNGIPFTNRNRKSTLVLKPLFLRDKMEEVEKMCQILGLDFNKIRREIELKKEPILLDTSDDQKKAVMELNIEGISAINSLDRYDINTLAKHILGYLNRMDQIGQTGVEKFYEDQLKQDKENSVVVVTDARDNLLQGIGYRILSGEVRNSKINVQLTLDYHIQKVVETIMDKHRIKGAIVIEDVKTGDVLALASKPDFDQNNVGQYLDSPRNELFNRAVASYNPGSIFKIIDAAAYLESDVMVNDDYYCTGSIRIGEKEYRCFNGISHGQIDFTQAFAQSCNCYFIKMGIKLGNKNLLEMAKRFGLGGALGVENQGIAESSGNLPVKKYFTDGDIANISIGQGEIMSTPLQAADITASIVNGGIKNRVNIVSALVDENGVEVKKIRLIEGKRIISRSVADRIKDLMDEVTTSGTGKKARLEEFGGAGGKTGSAETGQYINGEKVVHAWFTGYFPKQFPRYSVAVFVEDGKSGSEAAVPVFAEIAEEIIQLGY